MYTSTQRMDAQIMTICLIFSFAMIFLFFLVGSFGMYLLTSWIELEVSTFIFLILTIVLLILDVAYNGHSLIGHGLIDHSTITK